jgi:hypothetical protein
VFVVPVVSQVALTTLPRNDKQMSAQARATQQPYQSRPWVIVDRTTLRHPPDDQEVPSPPQSPGHRSGHESRLTERYRNQRLQQSLNNYQ